MKISFVITAALSLCLNGANSFTLAPLGSVSHSTSLSMSSEEGQDDRRAFITKSIIFVAALPFLFKAIPDAKPKINYADVSADIADLIRADPNKGPTLVRLAWHSSGTYDKMTKTGGSTNGTMRFKEELSHGANAGLEETAVSWMEPIREKYGDGLSYADLYTLSGVTAIKTMEGPVIPWSSGRVDAMDPSAVPPEGRLPKADSGKPGSDPSDADHLRQIFGRMGFNDQDIVALSGAHALGRCNIPNSGYDGKWTPTPTTFSNIYYLVLNAAVWKKRDWTGKFQYADESGRLMMLPTDIVLIEDENFKKYVDIYANDVEKFFTDFTAAFNKLEELGTKNLTKQNWAGV